jgi:uncharacterized protein (TIGR03435 family)
MKQFAAAIAFAGLMHAQSQPATQGPLAFEVISVKQSPAGTRGGMIRPMPGGQTYRATGATVRLMMTLMYKITNSQIAGAPGWIDSELYDVEAKAAKPSNIDELHEMFQTLLADRFKLRFHRETREIRAYVLTADKAGSKMKVHEGEGTDPFDIPIKPGGEGRIVGTRVPMSYFAWFIAQRLDTPVVDKTGLDKLYDFTLEPPRPDGDSGGPPVAPDFTALFAEFHRQLGLNLEQKKAPVEVFVIDHVERPAEN